MATTLAPEQQEELQLSDEDVELLRTTFEFFDADRSGAIDAKELDHALRILGQNPTMREIETLISEADVIAVDGKIDFVEFAKMMKTRLNEQAEAQQHLAQCFKVFDRENNGFLNVAAMKHVLTQRGEKMTEEEVEEMISFAGPDEKGRINYEAFVLLFTKSVSELRQEADRKDVEH